MSKSILNLGFGNNSIRFVYSINKKIINGITSNEKKDEISQKLRVKQLQKTLFYFFTSSKLFYCPSYNYFSFELSES